MTITLTMNYVPLPEIEGAGAVAMQQLGAAAGDPVPSFVQRHDILRWDPVELVEQREWAARVEGRPITSVPPTAWLMLGKYPLEPKSFAIEMADL